MRVSPRCSAVLATFWGVEKARETMSAAVLGFYRRIVARIQFEPMCDHCCARGNARLDEDASQVCANGPGADIEYGSDGLFRFYWPLA